MMIRVVAKAKIKKGSIEKFKGYAYKLIEETKKRETNISYNLYQDINNPQIITFIEEWKDEKALEVHSKTPHFIELVPKLRELQENETELNIYKEA